MKNWLDMQVPNAAAVELFFHKWEALRQFVYEEHEFYFLKAERLRGYTSPLPKFQDLLHEGGWLSKRSLSIKDVMHQSYAKYPKSILTISHTWFEKGNHFDPHNVKMEALSSYLQNHKEIREVWLDWGCLPQGERTCDEQALFNRTLPVVNFLYLGTNVLRIVGKDYFERFWPQFECYLSLQSIHKYGFENESGCTHPRCQTVFIEGDAEHYANDISFFNKCTYESAVQRLKDDAVKVTNQSDKTICLTKLYQLKEFMAIIFNTLHDIKS